MAIALGLLAARTGLRTIVAELANHEQLQQVFAAHAPEPVEPDLAEVEVAPGLFTIAIDPQRAMEEYLRVKAGPVGQMLGSTKLFQAFAMATPGMRELLSIGKVWELAQFERRTRDASPYDLVIVDAPASGHGVGILRTPRTFSEIARVGPIAHQGRQIAKTIADRSFTGIVAVSTAEEMPVNETLALHEALLRDELDLDAVIVNGRYPERFSPEEAESLARGMAGDPGRPVRVAIRAALSERARSVTQAAQQARLEESFPGIVSTLPFVFAPELGPGELEALADELERSLP